MTTTRTSQAPTHEYRIGFTLTDQAPRGAGTYWTPNETFANALLRLEEIARSVGEPGSGVIDAWMESRPVMPWTRVNTEKPR